MYERLLPFFWWFVMAVRLKEGMLVEKLCFLFLNAWSSRHYYLLRLLLPKFKPHFYMHTAVYWRLEIRYFYCHWWGNKTISVNFPQLVSKLPKLLRMISQPTVKSFDIHPETQTNIWSALCWFRAGVPLYCASPTEPLKPANWASPSVAREFTQLTQR